VHANHSTLPVAIKRDLCMSDGVLYPVGDSAEHCASCSTRSTISFAALSACSSASSCCALRLRLGAPFVIIDVPDSCSSGIVSLTAA